MKCNILLATIVLALPLVVLAKPSDVDIERHCSVIKTDDVEFLGARQSSNDDVVFSLDACGCHLTFTVPKQVVNSEDRKKAFQDYVLDEIDEACARK